MPDALPHPPAPGRARTTADSRWWSVVSTRPASPRSWCSRAARTATILLAATMSSVAVGTGTGAGTGATDGAPPPAAAPASPQAPVTPAAPLRVAVTIPPQAWLVERLLGDRADTFTVVNPGQSHETYQPTDREASRVMQATLFFAIGLDLERGPWFDAVRRTPGVTVVDCRAGIVLRTLETPAVMGDAPAKRGDHDGHDHDHAQDGEHDHAHDRDHHHAHQHAGGSDPHIWLTPSLLVRQSETMADAIAAARPDLADQVRAARRALVEELEALDEHLAATLKPVHGRAILVFHPSWGYFTDAYGLRQLVVENAGRPPSDRELTRVQEVARAEGIRVLFVEPQIGGRAAVAVATAIGGDTVTIDPLARDVPQNLLRVAEAMKAACQ